MLYFASFSDPSIVTLLSSQLYLFFFFQMHPSKQSNSVHIYFSEQQLLGGFSAWPLLVSLTLRTYCVKESQSQFLPFPGCCCFFNIIAVTVSANSFALGFSSQLWKSLLLSQLTEQKACENSGFRVLKCPSSYCIVQGLKDQNTSLQAKLCWLKPCIFYKQIFF